MRRLFLLFAPLLTVFSCLTQQNKSEAIPDLLYADGMKLAALRDEYVKEKNGLNPRIDLMLRCAGEHMNVGPFSVMQKDFIPPSGDKHDYISQGPYWWPDTTKPDGLPYIRRDGVVNPEREKFTDRQNMRDLINTTGILSKAYYITGEEKYAHRSRELLDIWFIKDSTRMNPNLEYGQGIPGRTEGRGIGIIETAQIGRIADVLTLISSSSAWSKAFDDAMKTWLKQYLDWLLTSEKGKDESVHPNNHGTWYDVQTISLAICTGQLDLARPIAGNAKAKRFDSHIMQDGSQPMELARTKSFSYSSMNLKGLMHIAFLAGKVDVDLWNYSNKNGATIQNALDYLLPAVTGEESWTYEQLTPISRGALDFQLFLASKYYDQAYANMISSDFNSGENLDCEDLELIFFGL